MSRIATTLLSVLLILCVPALAAAQIQTAGSGSWTAGSTWIGGIVPGETDDVFINSGHTVSVDDLTAVGRSISFGGDDALIDMNASTMLTVYGDFTLFSTAHTVFSAGWSGTNAYIKFAGDAVQTLSGFNTGGGSTSFRDVIVDKTDGKVTTDASGMRLGIQNSLEIVNGLMELAEGDDLEGRWASSGNFRGAGYPSVTIQAGGEFYLTNGGGVHHIRAGVGTPIGTVTVYGKATFQDGSTYRINLTAVDIENGGKVITGTGMGGGEFDCGPLVVKAGGELENYTTSDCWGTTAAVTLEVGGLFDTKSSTTIFPASFTNSGTVRYSREATSDQTVVDMDYHRLEISLDADNNKNWDLAAGRVIADSLKVNFSANLVLTAASAQTLTIGNMLHLSSGHIDNSDADVSLVLSDGVLIKRVIGTISDAPVFAGTVDMIYASTSVNVTTGPEMPVGTGVLNDLELTGDEGMTLGADVTVNGTCSATGSDIFTDAYTLTLGPAASLVESDNITVVGTVSTTRTVSQSVNETFGDIGIEINAAGGAPGVTTVTRVTGTALSIDGTDGIERYFDLSPANNNGLDATVVFHYDESELGGIDENYLASYSYDGGSWTQHPSTPDASGNNVTCTGVDLLATMTLGSEGTVATMLHSFFCAPAERGIEVSWKLSDAGLIEGFIVSREKNGSGGFLPIDAEVVKTGDMAYLFVDNACEPGTEYRYRIDAIDEEGTKNLFVTESMSASVPKLELSQNYPNPFNPATVISYSIPNSARVVLDIYDPAGRRVTRLIDEVQTPGVHTKEWTGLNEAGNPVASGVYFYKLITGKESITKKMVLLR